MSITTRNLWKVVNQYSAVKLGRMFGVTEYAIKDVIRGKSWGWL